MAIESMDVSGVNGPIDEIEMKSSIESDHPNSSDDGDAGKYEEIEANCWQVWSRNWRQFTSVLPGLILLLTIGMYNVSNIYECYQFGKWPKLLNEPKSFLNSANEISRPHSGFENQNNQNNYEPMRRYKRAYFDLYETDYDSYDEDNEDVPTTTEAVNDWDDTVFQENEFGEIGPKTAVKNHIVENSIWETERTTSRDRNYQNETDQNAIEEIKSTTSTVAPNVGKVDHDSYDEFVNSTKEAVDHNDNDLPYRSDQRSTDRNEMVSQDNWPAKRTSIRTWSVTPSNVMASQDNDPDEIAPTAAVKNRFDEDSNWSAERTTIRDRMNGIYVWTAPNETHQNAMQEIKSTTSTVAPYVKNMDFDEDDYVVEEVRPSMTLSTNTYDRDENIRYGKTTTESLLIQRIQDASEITDAYQPVARQFIFVMVWFCGAIVGNLFGALLVCRYKKRTIYVSFDFDFASALYFF